jgi:Protein of unknown function (DUF2846)
MTLPRRYSSHLYPPPLLALLVLFMLLTGCASTPQASRERDAEARQFASHPGHSTLFVYRPIYDGDEDTVLWVDGKLIGATLPKSFFRVNVNPGKHTLSGMGNDNGTFSLETRPGELYFVELYVISGHSHYREVSPDLGKSAINRCCALLETWAPGQRPLLR